MKRVLFLFFFSKFGFSSFYKNNLIQFFYFFEIGITMGDLQKCIFFFKHIFQNFYQTWTFFK